MTTNYKQQDLYVKYLMYRSIREPKQYDIYMVFYKKPQNINILESGWNTLDRGKPLVFRLFFGLSFEQGTKALGFLLDL